MLRQKTIEIWYEIKKSLFCWRDDLDGAYFLVILNKNVFLKILIFLLIKSYHVINHT